MLKNEAQFPIPGRMLSAPDRLGPDGEYLWRTLGKLLLDELDTFEQPRLIRFFLGESGGESAQQAEQ